MAFPMFKLSSDERRLLTSYGYSRAGSLIKSYNSLAKKKDRGPSLLTLLEMLDEVLRKAAKSIDRSNEEIFQLIDRLMTGVASSRKALAAAGVKG